MFIWLILIMRDFFGWACFAIFIKNELFHTFLSLVTLLRTSVGEKIDLFSIYR